ncbi:hypothetical protein G6F63_013922 [Rhizopus arrhizus]|nr:hypothetical protein G6F63_013922 [Rhizopus arrhizus]
MAQQRVDLRRAATEGLEVLRSRTAAAARQDFIAEARTGFSQCLRCFLERGVGIGAEHLGPLVAVVTRRVATGENVAELVREAVPDRRMVHRHVRTHAIEQRENAVLRRLELAVQQHVEQAEFQLAHGGHAAVEIAGGQHALVQRARQRFAAIDVRGHALQVVPFPAEVLHELRRQFDGVPFHAGERRGARLVHFGQQCVQGVAGFVEQGDDVVMSGRPPASARGRPR